MTEAADGDGKRPVGRRPFVRGEGRAGRGRPLRGTEPALPDVVLQAHHERLERRGGTSSCGAGQRWLLCGSGSISTVKQICRMSFPAALSRAKTKMCWHRLEKTDPAEMDHVSLSGRRLADVTFRRSLCPTAIQTGFSLSRNTSCGANRWPFLDDAREGGDDEEGHQVSTWMARSACSTPFSAL